MVTAVIAISSALVFGAGVLTGYFIALKALQTGLKWKIQVERQEQPTTPAQDAKTGAEVAKEALSNAAILDEWLNGPKQKDDEE